MRSELFLIRERAERSARELSRLDRCTLYVVQRRTGDVVGYAVEPCGILAPWDTLIATYDCGERF